MNSHPGTNLSALTVEERELLAELLADRALFGLEDAEAQRLTELMDKVGIESDDSFDLAAAAGALAVIDSHEHAPATVMTRIGQAAESFVREMENGRNVMGTPALRLTESDVEYPVARRINGAWLGWIAAAACLAFGAVGWIQIFANRQMAMTVPGSLATLRESVGKAADSRRLAWGDWDKPEIAGVKGEVVWSDSNQKGYMVFRGLPANDPGKEQYQLWIVDERGLAQRVSGGIFNGGGQSSGWQGEVRSERVGEDLIVEISPRIHVGKVALFAVTIEQPGGTWVSDMKRRVCVAAAGG